MMQLSPTPLSGWFLTVHKLWSHNSKIVTSMLTKIFNDFLTYHESQTTIHLAERTLILSTICTIERMCILLTICMIERTIVCQSQLYMVTGTLVCLPYAWQRERMFIST